MACFAAALPASGQVVGEIQTIDPPRQGFYSKRLPVRGIAILAHASVSDAAVEEAGRRIERLVGRSPGIAANLAALGVEMHVIGKLKKNRTIQLTKSPLPVGCAEERSASFTLLGLMRLLRRHIL